MRILAITYCRAMFGANKALLAMIKDLRDRYNVETEVLMPLVNDGELAEVLDQEGFVHYEMSMKMWVCPVSSNHRCLRSVSAQVKTFFLSGSIGKLLDDSRYDLIYTNNSAVQYGAILAKKWKLPHVWHIREFGHSDYDFDFIYPVKKRIKYFQSAYKVITISDAVRRYAEEEVCPGANVCRIYDGVNLSKKPRYADNASVSGVSSKAAALTKIACAGALQPGKNQMELLEAVKLLMDRGLENFRVFLIGDGPDEGRLRDYVRDNGLESAVEFCGYREDVRQMLDTMDIGVICSKSEGFGLVTCEYMESSMPVIGADSGATPELIKDGDNGYLYPLGKTDILADRLCELIKDKSKRIHMGMKAYERVYQDFSLMGNTDEMYKVFCAAVRK